MTDREKLTELLMNLPQVNHFEAALHGMKYVFQCAADYLIANGVTVKKERYLLKENGDLVPLDRVWIPVTERLPESGVHVLLCCEIRSNGAVYKKYVCDGYYAKRYTEQTWNNSGDIACEYREEDDEYYLLEGWYEVIKNWDDYNSIVIGDFVTHWMPLPEPPKEVE